MSLVVSRAVVAQSLLVFMLGVAQAQNPFGGDDPFGGPADPFGGAADPFGGGGEIIGGDDPFGGDPDEQPPLPKVKNPQNPAAVEVVIKPRVAKTDGESDAKIEKALASKTNLEFIETPLTDVMDFIADLHGIDVEIDVQALEDVGLGKDTPITRNLKGISLRSALRLMLKELDLTYVVRGGVLIITTPEESESEGLLEIKIYPIRHLLKSSDPLVERNEYAMDDLIELVSGLTRPYTWEDVGGPGSIIGLRNSLIVSQTHEVHEELRDTLAMLADVQEIVKQSKRNPPKVVSLPRLGKTESEIQKALSADIAVDFIETPLQDVVDFIKHTTKIEIQIDHRALEDVGLGSDTPITLKLKGVSLAATLRIMLREMDLTYVARDEVLLITTPEEAESALQTRIFPVADLIYPADDDEWVTTSDYYGASSADYDSLIDLITYTVRPTMWEEVGGPGAIEPWNDCLVFSQTDEVFDDVERLLTGLRKLKAEVGDDPRRVIAEPIRLDEAASPKIARLREALGGEVGMLAFKRKSLQQVMQAISEKHDVPILIDRRAMEDVGIDPTNKQITATLGGESLSQALRRLLRPFDLTWVLRDEVIMISTPEEAESELINVIYAVGDMVMTEAEEFSYNDGNLLDTITSTVRPTTWDDYGGPGAIELYPKYVGLVVSQTEEVNEEIAELLAMIRQAEAATMKDGDDVGAAKPAAKKIEVLKDKQGERLYLKVYQLANKEPELSKELDEVIRELVEPKSWKADESYYLRPLSGAIIIRQTAATHRKIDSLLRELDVLPWPQFSGSGFGSGIDNGQGFGEDGAGLGDGFNMGGGVFAVPDRIQGNFGGGPFDCGSFGPPIIRTIRGLSLPATDDQPAMPLRVHYYAGKDGEDVVATIRELVEPKSWDSPGSYLRMFNNHLIVRQSRPVHTKVDQLLSALGRYVTREPIDGGAGLRSVIPVVGEK